MSSKEVQLRRVTVKLQDGVADVRLNRPHKMNALDDAMFTALVATGEELAADRQIRAVVISGEGRCFCAGLDLSALRAMGGDDSGFSARSGLETRPAGRITNRGQQSAWVWSQLEVPVIAAIHGFALGGGLQIALGADLRLVSPDAQLCVLEIRWGLTPDGTGTYFLPRLVGHDVAKELTWTGRMVSGEEAVRLGLATRVAGNPRQEALALATAIASSNPHAIQAAKRLLATSLGQGPAEQFADEERSILALIGTSNQREAVHAHFENRRPSFADPE